MKRLHKTMVLVMVSTLVIMAAALPVSAKDNTVYDFNLLNTGDINGQDNWTTEDVGTQGGTTLNVVAGGGYDGTKALLSEHGGGNRAEDASRLNDENFSIPVFSGSESAAFFEADFSSGYWGHEFGFGCDCNSNGKIRRYESGERGVRLRLANQSNTLFLYDASGGYESASYDPSAWTRFRVVMDFTANSGQGAASVYAKDLTGGATEFSAVPGLQDINIHIDTSATDAQNPANWNGMYMNFESSPGGFDNISMHSSEAEFAPRVSTLNHWTIVAMITLFAGLLVWTMRRKRLAP